MSTISASTTSTTAYKVTADTTGTLVLQTGASPTTALTIDTSQNTTVAGNLTLSGTAKRITGDFSNATLANRAMFQSSTTNGNTVIYAIPNGTSTTSAFSAINTSGAANGNRTTISANSGDCRLESEIIGTGSYLPLLMFTGGIERMRIDTSGNVGIGTNSAGQKLVTASNATDSKIEIQNTNSASTTNKTSGLQFSGTDTVGTLKESGDIYVTPADANYVASNMVFYTRIADAVGERMRIDGSGRAQIALNTGTAQLNVFNGQSGSPLNSNWDQFALALNGAYGGGIALIDGSPGAGGYAIWVDDNGNDFNIAGATSGGATPSGGVYLNNSAGSWSTRSDERLKQNLEPITDAVDKVLTLRAVVGEYIDRPDQRQPFLIAQDVQAVLPEAVSVVNKKDPEQYLGVAYTAVVPLLVAAIKELKAELDTAKTDIATLKGAA